MLLTHLAEAHERQTQTLATCQRAQTALQTAFEVVCMQLLECCSLARAHVYSCPKLLCDHTQTPPPLTCQTCLVMLVLPVLTLVWHQECDDVSDALLEAADNAGIIHPPNRRHDILKSEGSSHY
jgi:hypothetical protein